jgi:hypothetical protein
MKIEKIIDGLYRYIEDKMFPTMVNWQRVAARTFMLRVKRKPEIISKVIPTLNLFEYADENDNIDIDCFIEDFRESVRVEGELEFAVPLLGVKYKLSPSDVNELCNYLKS